MKTKIVSILLTLALLCTISAVAVFADSRKLGDVDADGDITAVDARLALRAAAKLDKLDDDASEAADVDFDGDVTAVDARRILRVAAKIDVFPEKPSEDPSAPDEPSSDEPSSDEPSTEEPSSDEPSTAEPPSDEPSTDPDVAYPEAIDAFFAGTYYLEGNFGDDDELAKIAVNGNNFEMVMPFDNAQIAFASINDSKYIKATDTQGKKYSVELTQDVLDSLGESMGIDIGFDSLLADFSFTQVTEYGKPVLTTGEVNGQDCLIYTFTLKESTVLFYTVNDEIVRIETVDANGASSFVAITTLSAEIPDDMLTLDGYTATSLLTLAMIFIG